MSGHETFVVISDGRPTTVIKSKSKDSNRNLPFKFSGKGKESIDQIEAKRLKTENALLLHKIKVLEEEINVLTNPVSHQEQEELNVNLDFNQQLDMSNRTKMFNNVETQTFFLDLESHMDINCNNMTCLQCGSTINSNVDLVRLVDQANRNSATNQIMLRIESPKIFSPVTPQGVTPDHSSDSMKYSDDSLPCIQQQFDETFQTLQEELVACKLREAESSLGFKELQQKVNQLGKQWQQFLKDNEYAKNSGDIKTRTLLDLREAIMALKVREACMISDFNELKQKLIELETENNISKRQSKRLEDELEKFEEKLSKSSLREDELVNQTKELERRTSDLNTKYQEDLIMFKIKDAEWCQDNAHLRRKVAELEIENQELATAFKLSNPKHSEIFEKIISQQHNVKDKFGRSIEDWKDPRDSSQRPSDKSDVHQSVMELLSRCDMSDIMTESFIADTIFLQPSSLMAEDSSINQAIDDQNINILQNVRLKSPDAITQPDKVQQEYDDVSNLQSLDCDSLERLDEE